MEILNNDGVVIFTTELDSLRGANLRGANLIDANLIGADLRGANLRGANLIDANLIGADLSGANLIDADLRGADLRGANLIDANLIGADLRGANLIDANLIGADLRGANLRGADLSGAIMPIYCKWSVSTKNDNIIKIGCKENTIEGWNLFFDSSEVYNTQRGTEDFKRIYANFKAVEAYLNVINSDYDGNSK